MLIRAIYEFLDTILSLYWWAIVLSAVISNLLAFGILDRHNRAVWMIGDFLYRITDPVLRPFRNFLPNFGGIDISPIFALLLITLTRRYLLPGVFYVIRTGDLQGFFY